MQYLWQYTKFTREHRDMLVLVPLVLPQLFPVRGELVEQMVNDVRLEDLHSERVGQLLSISFNFYVEG